MPDSIIRIRVLVCEWSECDGPPDADYRDMIAAEDLDAIIIASPNNTRASVLEDVKDKIITTGEVGGGCLPAILTVSSRLVFCKDPHASPP